MFTCSMVSIHSLLKGTSTFNLFPHCEAIHKLVKVKQYMLHSKRSSTELTNESRGYNQNQSTEAKVTFGIDQRQHREQSNDNLTKFKLK